MDIARRLAERLSAALRESGTGPRRIAIAVNTDRPGLAARVTTDADVTAVETDGATRVYRHHASDEEDDRC
jgi:hypothetical protein